MWFLTLMRTFFFALDNIVYNFIPKVYDLLLMIARTSPLSQADIAGVADRIYKFLAIFMVFKVTLSLITYVVNPDEFSDKTKGVSKLAQNAIVSLCVLILTPYIFSYAYQLQSMILEDNALGTLVFGEEKSAFNKAGEEMAFITLSAFFSPDASLEGLNECTVITKNVVGDKTSFNQSCSGLDSNYDPLSTEIGLYKKTINNEENFSQTTLKNYVAGVEGKSLGMMFRKEMAIASDKDKNYIMDYQWLISTAVGVIILLLLVTYCMDIAVRSIKLAFLQLIAPIPVISYIDPKSGKDGLFKKWYETCFKTYLSLFIRLLVIYLAVYIISIVSDLQFVDVITGEYQTGLLIKVFIIIGALMFAKQLPEILKGLGIKLDGDGKFFLNPLKKFEEQALGGKRITGAAGALTAGAMDRAARLVTAPGFKGKVGALLGTGPGLLGAAARGFSSNAGFKGGLEKQAQVNRRLREGRTKGLTPMSSYLDYAGSKFGLDDATLEKDNTIDQRNEDAIMAAETELENKNRENTLKIENEKKHQTTRKNTKNKFDNVKKQGDRLLKTAEDFTTKKGDFDLGDSHKKKMEALDKKIADARAAGKDRIEVGRNEDGSVKTQSLDEYYAREKRKINARNYKSNRNADEANLQHLTDHNGEVLTSTFMIGDQLFEAGTKIDGDLIASAKAAQGKYIKDSQKAVTNEMDRMSKDPNLLTGEDAKFYNDNKSDFDSFSNINKEFQGAISAANEAVNAYNSEYDAEIKQIETSNDEYKGDIYKMIKEINGNMESGASITEINNELAESESKIEAWERANENNRKETFVRFTDDNGHRSRTPITLDEAKSRHKIRKENTKRKMDQHNQHRSLMENIAAGKK